MPSGNLARREKPSSSIADILRANVSNALSVMGVSGVKKNLLFACVLS